MGNIKNSLEENKFVKKVSTFVSKIILENTHIDENNNYIDKKPYDELCKEKIYIIDVFYAISDILNTIDQLEYVPIFLRRFPIRKYYAEEGISHPKYLRYHIENHFIRLSTLSDQIAILVNEIFNLGLPHKKCSIELLLEIKHLKNTEILKLLKSLRKGIQGVKTIRNDIIHRGIFVDKEFSEIEKIHLIYEDVETKNNIISYADVRSITREYIKEKIDFLVKNNDTIFGYLNLLFNSLDSIFDKKLSELKVPSEDK